MTGKVVRYLQDNGAEVKQGEPYVEVEAMKMIMPIKASESGKIIHNLSPGSVIAAGDLLASLELKDPSKVKKITAFTGKLKIAPSDIAASADPIKTILAGYSGDPDAAVANAFAGADLATATALLTDTLTEYVRVEKLFAGKIRDDVVRELTKANADNLEIVIAENLAHMKLKQRTSLVMAMLRELETFPDRFGTFVPTELMPLLQDLASMKDKSYGEVSLAADSIIRMSKVPSFDSRVAELRSQLLDKDTDYVKLSKSPTLSAGVDLLTYLFADKDEAVQKAAIEVYVRRVYRAHRVLDLNVGKKNGRLACSFNFQSADVSQSEAPIRQGVLEVVESLKNLKKDLPRILDDLSEVIGGKPATTEAGPLNTVHLAVSDASITVDDVSAVLTANKAKLDLLGVNTVNILLPNDKKDPSYFAFSQSECYEEDPLRRNMRPTFHYLLELGRLSANFDLERIPAIGRNAQVYIGSEKSERPQRGGPPQVLFVRAISHSVGLMTESGARKALQQGLDELERAQANSKVNMQSSSRIYLHSLHELEGLSTTELADKFKEIADELSNLRIVG